MATPPDARDRLQPALLDRLTDDEPLSSVESDDRRFVSKAAFRQAVIRDLSWLLNAVQPLRASQAAAHSHAAHSVLNFGLPALAGQAASKVDVSLVEKAIRSAIVDFEPRIAADSLSVRAIESDDVLSSHNVIEFEIHGLMWAQPVPLELLLRTQLDLEAGQVQVHDVSAGVAATLRSSSGGGA